jgi:hypothetical protein
MCNCGHRCSCLRVFWEKVCILLEDEIFELVFWLVCLRIDRLTRLKSAHLWLSEIENKYVQNKTWESKVSCKLIQIALPTTYILSLSHYVTREYKMKGSGCHLVTLGFLVSWGGVRLSLLGTSATIWPIVPVPNDRWWMWSSRWNEHWQGKQKYSEKLVQVPLCPPQIPHDPTWARTRAAAVGSRRLT